MQADAAELIALLGDGSYRDTYGILEKVLTYSQDKIITRDEVEKVTGSPTASLILDFVQGIASKDSTQSLRALREAQEKNIDVRIFTKLAITALRHIFMLRIDPASAEKIKQNLGTSEYALYEKIAKDAKANISSKTLETLLESYQRIDSASFVPSLPLELAVAELTK